MTNSVQCVPERISVGVQCNTEPTPTQCELNASSDTVSQTEPAQERNGSAWLPYSQYHKASFLAFTKPNVVTVCEKKVTESVVARQTMGNSF
jgi:hypothetical protein